MKKAKQLGLMTGNKNKCCSWTFLESIISGVFGNSIGCRRSYRQMLRVNWLGLFTIVFICPFLLFSIWKMVQISSKGYSVTRSYIFHIFDCLLFCWWPILSWLWSLCLKCVDLFSVFISFPFFSSDKRICSPPFMVLNTDCSPDVLEQIKRQGLTFPFSEYFSLSQPHDKEELHI